MRNFPACAPCSSSLLLPQPLPAPQSHAARVISLTATQGSRSDAWRTAHTPRRAHAACAPLLPPLLRSADVAAAAAASPPPGEGTTRKSLIEEAQHLASNLLAAAGHNRAEGVRAWSGRFRAVTHTGQCGRDRSLTAQLLLLPCCCCRRCRCRCHQRSRSRSRCCPRCCRSRPIAAGAPPPSRRCRCHQRSRSRRRGHHHHCCRCCRCHRCTPLYPPPAPLPTPPPPTTTTTTTTLQTAHRASSWSMMPCEVVRMMWPNWREGSRRPTHASMSLAAMSKRGLMAPHLLRLHGGGGRGGGGERGQPGEDMSSFELRMHVDA